MSEAVEQVWETSDDGAVTITLKGSGAPWIVLRYKSVDEAVAAFEKNDGAQMMLLFRLVSGAEKAYGQVYNNREAPEASTQGKPEGADNPSPQVKLKSDPFEDKTPTPPAFEAVKDDAPPFYEKDAKPKAEVEPCKHGERKLVPHGGKKYWTCGSELPREDPDRCPPVIL